MRRRLLVLSFTALACHTDSVMAPDNPGGGTVSADAKNMSVGEVRVLTPSQVPNGIELTPNTAATNYLVVVANTSTNLDVPASYVVRGNQLAGDALRTDVASAAKMLAVADGDGDAQEVADARIRNWERSHLTPSRAASRGFSARSSFSVSGSVTVGSQVAINVPDENAKDLCTTFFSTTGTVKAVTKKAIIVQDNNTPAGGFTQADFDAIAAEFDNVVFPTDSSYFGKPTDIDNNGHVVLYYTPEVNKLTPAGQPSFIGGFFFAGDLFPTAQCKESNVGEIFYLLAPDPNKVFGNTRTTVSVRQGTRGTVAHEFQHMINAGNRIVSGASAFESVWLDEGLAHTAEDAVGRTVRGFGDFQTLSDTDLFQSGNATVIDAYNAFFIQNLKRFSTWLARPDTSSGLSKHADQNLSSRGAIWALLRWTGDQYSGGNFRAYTRKLAAGPDTGIKNLTTAAAQPLDTLLAGWLVTNFSDHTGIAGLPSKYNYVGYNMRSAVVGAIASGTTVPAYPLMVTTLASGGGTNAVSTLPGSATYYKVSVPAGGTRTIKVLDSGGTTNASFSGAHFYVLRID